MAQKQKHQHQNYLDVAYRRAWYFVGFLFRCKWIFVVGTTLIFQYILWRQGRRMENDGSSLYGAVRERSSKITYTKLPVRDSPDLVHDRPVPTEKNLTPGQSLHFITTYGMKTFARTFSKVTSMVGWEQLAPFVGNVQVGSFCLGWENKSQEASDLWWTHHPDWDVFNETEEGYCYRPHPDELQREYLASIYQHQFHHSTRCSNLFVTRMWSSGWSADIYNLVHGLQYAMIHGQPMEITNNPWHYAAPDQAGRSNPVPSPPRVHS